MDSLIIPPISIKLGHNMLSLKKYKGPVDLNILEKIVNECLRKNPSAEIRSHERLGYQILINREGIDFGLISPSTLSFIAKNPTQISLDLAKELAGKLNLNITFLKPRSDEVVTLDKEQLKVEHLE